MFLDASVTTTLANLSLDHHGLQGKQAGANRIDGADRRITIARPSCPTALFKDIVEDTKLVPGDQITVQCASLVVRQCRGHARLMLNANLDAEAQYEVAVLAMFEFLIIGSSLEMWYSDWLIPMPLRCSEGESGRRPRCRQSGRTRPHHGFGVYADAGRRPDAAPSHHER